MERHVDFDEISDGKRYSRSAMVRLGCNECEGCSACCHDMESAVLDPWDIWQLTLYLECNFEQLLEKYVELKITDGLILPRLKMDGADKNCHFLNQEGRCSIHQARPGVCRLFPLGRLYEGEGFSYFLQIHECKKEKRSKVKIEKWLGIPGLPKYEAYICNWHSLLKRIGAQLDSLDEAQVKTLHLLLLRTFFQDPYEKDDFYGQFEKRYAKVVDLLGI